MLHKITVLSIVFSLVLSRLAGQQSPFTIELEAQNILNLGGLQSYAFGQYEGKWLLVGGRLDGLHRRQPFASFDVAGNNNHLIVIDPATNKKWTAPLTSLPVAMQEQLSSTNMEFWQQGSYLYVIGGYGYNAATSSRKTFNKITAINVKATIDAIVIGNTFDSFFRQQTDEKFAVTGGHLKKINNQYYLLGGNRFDGNYNPMGGPSYTQVYTDEIRIFEMEDDGNNWVIKHIKTLHDANAFHRRDYNAVPQILPNGMPGITMFSGVFKPTIDLPFLDCVNIDSTSYTVNTSFNQYYNHYHCAVVPMYSSQKNEMHNVFFGGIAQYFDSSGILVQDNNVPFVKTIARVSRSANGQMTEYKLPIEMPNYLGASAEFIPLKNLAHYPNEVLNFDLLPDTKTLIGHIFGGISSSAPNIFFTNTGTQSTANNTLYKVYVTKNTNATIDAPNNHSTSTMHLQIQPNPNGGEFELLLNSIHTSNLEIKIFTLTGHEIYQQVIPNHIGETRIKPHIQLAIGAYYVTLQSAHGHLMHKVLIH